MMMINDKLDGRSLARIWINEVPNLETNVVDVLKYSVESTLDTQWDEGIMVLELFLGPRHMSNYAYLGMKYEKRSNNKEFLEIEISVSEYEGRGVQDNIALSCDQVVAGIPREYANEVLKTVKDRLKNIKCPNGNLAFFIGAHGYVGSSQVTFRKITEILLMLVPKINHLSKEEISQTILKEVLSVKIE